MRVGAKIMFRLFSYKLLIMFIMFGVIVLPSQASAKPLPFMPDKKGDELITPTSSDSLFGGIAGSLESLLRSLYNWGVIIITALFVIGTLVMILSILFRNGQWQKYAQGTMFISFVVMLVLRGMPILLLSIKSSKDIDILLHDLISALSNAAIFLGITSIFVSLLFRFGYRLIEHPEFHRWSKNLLSVSILMMIFSIVIPIIFPIF